MASFLFVCLFLGFLFHCLSKSLVQIIYSQLNWSLPVSRSLIRIPRVIRKRGIKWQCLGYSRSFYFKGRSWLFIQEKGWNTNYFPIGHTLKIFGWTIDLLFSDHSWILINIQLAGKSQLICEFLFVRRPRWDQLRSSKMATKTQ